ncbi:TRAP transporter small permease [Poseidonocella sp. HB161398]|uniref:TRAP transporter small permease n=1 Tax=Poseidonocella sp. HB161398 TaxID=2320855 RepID=UPI0011091EF3|nr:TRAP transporter small permease subunit [Poseidonocella sp. HB161398]
MNILKFLDRALAWIIQPVLVALGLAVAVLLAWGIFSRSVLGAPVFGLEELMLIGVMWFYMLGAVMASRERSHLSADFVRVMTRNPRIHRAADIFSTAVSLVVALAFVTWSWSLVSFGLERGQSTPVFGIPWWVSQAALLVAAVLFVAYLLRDLVQEIRGRDIHSGNPEAEVN